MGFGLGMLRLAPDVFWGMTLRELAAAVRGMLPVEGKIDRAKLDHLMRKYPDR
jgi:uncharacterized phage protein (TIGR02216 family)